MKSPPSTDACAAATRTIETMPLTSIRGFRPFAPPANPSTSADHLLDRIALSVKSPTSEHFAAIDELLDGTYPGIDVLQHGSKAMRMAAYSGNLAVIAHLFGHVGSEGVKLWDPAHMERIPIASCIYIEALSEKRAFAEALPEAIEPAPQKPRLRRL